MLSFRKIVLVSGTSGAGKTTLVHRLGQMGYATMHTGNMVRKRYMHLVEKSSSSYAPEQCECTVREEILAWMERCEQYGFEYLAIESLPKNDEQYEWFRNLIKKSVSTSVIWLECDEQIRLSRIDGRDAAKSDLSKRKVVEERSIPKTNIPFRVLPTDNGIDQYISLFEKPYMDLLQSLMVQAFNVSNMITGSELHRLVTTRIGHYLRKLQDEAYELHVVADQFPIPMAEMGGELADILVYAGCILLCNKRIPEHVGRKLDILKHRNEMETKIDGIG